MVYSDFTAPGDPVHGGEWAGLIDVLNDTGWSDTRYTFPEPVDLSQVDEFRLWVYSDQPFRMRVDMIIEIVMGYRYYTPDDVGSWKEFVFWISKEQSKLWEEELKVADRLRFWINPSSTTNNGVDYPQGFEGMIFIDDMQARKRVPVEREFLPLIGFNDPVDEDLVSLQSGGVFFEVDQTGFPEPVEGDGVLAFEFTSGWNENIVIDLKQFPQILDYDRLHLDFYVDGTGSWAASALILRSSWIDAEGNSRGTGWGTLSENIISSQHIGSEWAEFSGQYGPVQSNGFANDWIHDEVSGVFDDPDGTLTLTLTSQGAADLDGVLAYIDNIRLSRPIGASVDSWDLY